MAAAAHLHDEHEDHPHHMPVNGKYHQYQDIHQQNETYSVGMWTFLVQEIMFFGALFVTYALYRWRFSETFYWAHKEIHIGPGAINTIILLISSFTMVSAVHYAQRKQTKKVLVALTLTQICAIAFLVIKWVYEYMPKMEHHLVPGPHFEWTGQGSANAAQIFFSLYFTMTGLHAIHIIAGIIVIAGLMWKHWRGDVRVREDYMPTEMVALYWHFVDLVWVFLFPLYYLIPR